MSNSIDQRVVQMEFDNKNFQKGVESTVSSLKELDKGLKLENGAKGLQSVEEQSSKINFSGLKNALGTLAQGFSSVASVATSAFDSLASKISTLATVTKYTAAGMVAAITGIAVSGGIKRALNLEQAQFQLKGLGANVEEIMKNVNDAVSGTAYGLDAAAVVASQLTASGIEAGEGMTAILKGIAGVAAMSGREYSEVGQIFTTVAGQGQLMTMQLRQLEASGINAAATMAKIWGKTEEEVRDMVTKGEVSFEMFSSAMTEAFGEHAKAANNTFTGAMSNVKAALSRIGAEFAIPSLENLRKIFVALIPVINDVKKAMMPLVEVFTDVTTKGADNLVKTLQDVESMMSANTGLIDKFRAGLQRVVEYFSKLGATLSRYISPAFGDLTYWSTLVYNVFENFGLVADILRTVFEALGDGFLQALPSPEEFQGLSVHLGNLVRGFREFAQAVAESITGEHIAMFKSIGNAVGSMAKNVGTVLVGLFQGLGNALGPMIEYLWSKLPDVVSGMGNFFGMMSSGLPSAEAIADAFRSMGDRIGTFFKSLNEGKEPLYVFKEVLRAISGVDVNEGVFKAVGSFLEKLRDVGSGPLEKFQDFISRLLGSETRITSISEFVTALLNALSAFGSGIITAVPKVLSGIANGFSQVAEGFTNFTDTVSVDKILGFVTSLASLYMAFQGGKLFKSLNELASGGSVADMLGKFFGNVTDSMMKPINKVLGQLGSTLKTWQDSLNAEAIRNIAIAIGVLAASIYVLSTVDPLQLAAGIAALAAAMGILYGFLYLIDKMMSKSSLDPKQGLISFLKGLGAEFAQVSKFGAIASLLTSLAIAVGAMAVSIKLLSTMDIQGAITGVASFAVVMTVLVAALYLLSGIEKTAKKMPATLVALSAAVMALSLSMKLLSTIPLDKTPSALISLGGALAVFVGALAILEKNEHSFASAASLAVAALALLTIVPAIMLLSTLPFEKAMLGVVTMGSALLILGVALYAMQNSLAGSAALLVAAAALAVITPALIALSGLKLEQVGVALFSVAGALAIFGVAAIALSGAIVPMLGLGAAVALLGVGIATAGIGISAFTAALLALSAGGTASLNILVQGFKMLLEAVLTALPQIVTAVAMSLADMILALGSRIPEFVQLGVNLLSSLLTGIQTLIPQLISTGVAIIVALMQGITSYMSTLVSCGMQMLLTFINSMSMAIHQSHDQMYEAGKGLFMALLEAAISVLGQMAQDIGSFVMDIPAYISGEKQLFASAGEEIGTAVADSANDSLDGLSKVGEESVSEMMDGMASAAEGSDGIASSFSVIPEKASETLGQLPDIGSGSISDMVGSMAETASGTDGIFSGLGNSLTSGLSSVDFAGTGKSKMDELLSAFSDSSGMESAGEDQGNALSQGFESAASQLPDIAGSKTSEAVSTAGGYSGTANSAGGAVGSNFGSGMYYGMDGWISGIAQKAAEMVKAAKDAANAAQDSASPAKDTIEIGGWFAEGYKIGIERMSGSVARASGKLVDTAKDSLKVSADILSDIMQYVGADSEPVITPVLDLSRIQSDAARISGLLPEMQAISASGIGWSVTNSRAGLFAQSAQTQQEPTVINNYHLTLDWRAGASANDMLRELNSALRVNGMTEGK